MTPNEVFLSHSSKDREFVSRLAATLRAHGIPVWYSQTDILGAQQWHDEIGYALKRCDWLIVVLSPDSVEAMWVERELLYALNQKRFKTKIIPLYYRSCDFEALSWTLSNLQMIDFRGEFAEGCRELLRIWGTGYRENP